MTVESLLSRKPVVTTTDSGRTARVRRGRRERLRRAPEPEALAEAIDRSRALPEARLREMGEEGHRRVAHITWDAVLDRLTEGIR